MTEQSAVFRKKAAEDIAQAAFWCKHEAGEKVAERFIEQTQKAVEQANEFPGVGSLRFARVLAPLDIRCTGVAGFPYLIFYRETAAGIDVIRVLHSARDIPTHLQGTPDG